MGANASTFVTGNRLESKHYDRRPKTQQTPWRPNDYVDCAPRRPVFEIPHPIPGFGYSLPDLKMETISQIPRRVATA